MNTVYIHAHSWHKWSKQGLMWTQFTYTHTVGTSDQNRAWCEHSLHTRTQLAQVIKTGPDVNTVYTHTRAHTLCKCGNKSRRWHRLSWTKPFIFSPIPAGKFWHSRPYLELSHINFCHALSSSLFRRPTNALYSEPFKVSSNRHTKVWHTSPQTIYH